MERKQEVNVDAVIDKLLAVKNSKVPKQVNLLEGEIKGLCHKCKEIFMQQPIFLELEAPLKVCGNTQITQATSTVNTLTFLGCLITASTHPTPTTCSLATMSTEASSV